MSSDLDTNTNIVELNVGGKIFTTSKTTLMRYEDSMLALMLSDQYETSKDSVGRYFIDRDGDLFRYIINYLRTGKLLIDNFDLCDLYNLRIEADFYRLDNLIIDIDELIMRQQEKLAKKNLLEDEKLHHYQMENSKQKFDSINGYHLDLIEHNFLNNNTKRLQITCHYDVFKMLPLTSDDLAKLNELKQSISDTDSINSQFKSQDGLITYLGNDCFELLNITYLTRTQIGHILLQINAKLLHSNIAYLTNNSPNNNTINLTIMDKWFVPKYVTEKYTNCFMIQRALPPGRTIGYIDWNP